MSVKQLLVQLCATTVLLVIMPERIVNAQQLQCSPHNASAGRGQFLPHPKDCNKYIHCVNGVPHERLCPPSLHWHKRQQVCDYPARAQCRLPALVAQPLDTANCINGQYYAHASSCHQFYYCKFGERMLLSCGAGFHWHQRLQHCDAPEAAQCPHRRPVTTPVNGATYELCGLKLKLLPHPQDCTRFISCSNGHAWVMNCPRGLLWNAKSERCDFAFNVQCQAEENGETVKLDVNESRVKQESKESTVTNSAISLKTTLKTHFESDLPSTDTTINETQTQTQTPNLDEFTNSVFNTENELPQKVTKKSLHSFREFDIPEGNSPNLKEFSVTPNSQLVETTKQSPQNLNEFTFTTLRPQKCQVDKATEGNLQNLDKLIFATSVSQNQQFDETTKEEAGSTVGLMEHYKADKTTPTYSTDETTTTTVTSTEYNNIKFDILSTTTPDSNINIDKTAKLIDHSKVHENIDIDEIDEIDAINLQPSTKAFSLEFNSIVAEMSTTDSDLTTTGVSRSSATQRSIPSTIVMEQELEIGQLTNEKHNGTVEELTLATTSNTLNENMKTTKILIPMPKKASDAFRLPKPTTEMPQLHSTRSNDNATHSTRSTDVLPPTTRDPRLPFRAPQCRILEQRIKFVASNCQQFYQCYEGYAYLLNCYEGFGFNAELRKCVPIEHTNCTIAKT